MALYEIGALGAGKNTKIYLVYDDVTLKVSGCRGRGLSAKYLKVTVRKKGAADFARADFKDLIDNRGEPIADMNLSLSNIYLEKVPVNINDKFATRAERNAYIAQWEIDKGRRFPATRLVLAPTEQIEFEVDVEAMTRSEAARGQ